VDAHQAILNLAAIAVVLAAGPNSLRAALGVAGFVDDPDGLGMTVIVRHYFLAAISQLLFIPLDRFEEPL